MSSPFTLKSFSNELLGSNENNDEYTLIDIRDLVIREDSNHTYKMQTNTPRFQELVKSIGESGVHEPILVQEHPEQEFKYDVLAGRHRIEASKLNNLEKLPCIIKKGLSKEEADKIVNESILLHIPFEDLKHSERAAVIYQYHYEHKQQGKRTDLINEDESQEQEDKNGKIYQALSKTQIARYLKIYTLIDELKVFVDNESLSIRAGVVLAYFTKDFQKIIADYITERDYVVSLAIAEKLKKSCQSDISEEELLNVLDLLYNKLTEEKEKKITKISIAYKKIDTFFDESHTQEDIEETIIEALEFYNDYLNSPREEK